MQRYTRTPVCRVDDDPDTGYYAQPLPFPRLSYRSRLSAYQRPLKPLVYFDEDFCPDDPFQRPETTPEKDSDSS